jgi:hypothetical protein
MSHLHRASTGTAHMRSPSGVVRRLQSENEVRRTLELIDERTLAQAGGEPIWIVRRRLADIRVIECDHPHPARRGDIRAERRLPSLPRALDCHDARVRESFRDASSGVTRDLGVEAHPNSLAANPERKAGQSGTRCRLIRNATPANRDRSAAHRTMGEPGERSRERPDVAHSVLARSGEVTVVLGGVVLLRGGHRSVSNILYYLIPHP